ncbi:hypothetical protein CDD80_6448 [Ophiocordyceps camponoti-rufipedis]|uniref:Uncharacterized protein n=1 Tax=Ophiocordyceps camponoti-rufipedis TaxID=2004952 RepID=A0A2C5YM63_9HYPO|nr:hypothetical protein CDD80_6448 [Ophiocordyceps camponoti-rufipedis]
MGPDESSAYYSLLQCPAISAETHHTNGLDEEILHVPAHEHNWHDKNLSVMSSSETMSTGPPSAEDYHRRPVVLFVSVSASSTSRERARTPANEVKLVLNHHDLADVVKESSRISLSPTDNVIGIGQAIRPRDRGLYLGHSNQKQTGARRGERMTRGAQAFHRRHAGGRKRHEHGRSRHDQYWLENGIEDGGYDSVENDRLESRVNTMDEDRGQETRFFDAKPFFVMLRLCCRISNIVKHSATGDSASWRS